MFVLNVKDEVEPYTDTYATLDDKYGCTWMYVGRRNDTYRLAESPLANPYRLKEGESRGDTLERYKRWLWQKIKANDPDVMRELREIARRVEYLVCWCHPEPCHAEVIRDAVMWLVTQNWEPDANDHAG